MIEPVGPIENPTTEFEQLVSGVAHDLNNLLGIILMSASRVVLEEPRNDKALDLLGNIQKACRMGSALTEQVFNHVKGRTPAVRTLDLGSLAASMLKYNRFVIGERITTSLYVSPGLHPVKADSCRVEQVMMNLIINARDAMPSGGRLDIRLENCSILDDNTSVQAGQYVRLIVSDTGQGIPDGIKQHIFKPYFSTKGAKKGKGIGLSVVKDTVKRLGGFVTVDTIVGKGTTFTLYFPTAS